LGTRAATRIPEPSDELKDVGMVCYVISSVALGAHLLAVIQSSAGDNVHRGASSSSPVVSASIVEAATNAKLFKLRYQIRNRSDGDIWICDSMDLRSEWGDCEVYVGEDNETLFVQRRMNVPMQGARNQPIGRYARVPSGQTRTETISFSLPVHQRGVLFGTRGIHPAERASHLVLEIGYYEGDLPARIFQMLEGPESDAPRESPKLPVYGRGLTGMLGGPLFFNANNEGVRNRGEEVIVPWADCAITGEKTLRVVVDDLVIPYSTDKIKPTPIHLSPLRRIDVRFRASPLGFFFPCTQDQSLLSPEERQHLESLRDFVLKDRWDLMGIAYDASQAIDGIFFTERGVADLTCHRSDGSAVSLIAYDDAYLVTAEGQVFRCLEGVKRLRMLSAELKSFDLRVQCATNLKNLWYRFQLFHIARHGSRDVGESWKRDEGAGRAVLPETFGQHDRLYPHAVDWCDAMLQGYPAAGNGDDNRSMRIQQCPSGGKGRCDYAMNLGCRADSPSDMVLLFETKAGWNQHGGPELFTFDNHGPKGGLVLLNDGTVKFIRTEEELKQLRWK
jgi:hypothetical protein